MYTNLEIKIESLHYSSSSTMSTKNAKIQLKIYRSSRNHDQRPNIDNFFINTKKKVRLKLSIKITRSKNQKYAALQSVNFHEVITFAQVPNID